MELLLIYIINKGVSKTAVYHAKNNGDISFWDEKDIKIDYVGIRIPNKFIVGYGLDYDGLGRNLADVYQLAQ